MKILNTIKSLGILIGGKLIRGIFKSVIVLNHRILIHILISQDFSDISLIWIGRRRC